MSVPPVLVAFRPHDPAATYRLVERTGDAPLSIELTIRSEHDDPRPFLTLLIAAKDRWQDFRLHIEAREFSQWCLNVLRSINDMPALSNVLYLPRLTSLEVRLPVHTGYNLPPDQLNYYGAPVQCLFFRDWSTPALRQLEIGNNYPVQIRDALDIEACYLSFNTRLVQTWGLLPLAQFLSSSCCRRLTHLVLDFEQTEFAITESLPSIYLRNLYSLEVRLTDCDTPLRFLTIFSRLRTPVLQKLKLLVSLDMLVAQAQDEGVTDWIEALLAAPNNFRALRKLRLQIQSPGARAVAPLRTVFERCPNLHNLTISGNLHPPPVNALPGRVPPLRKLKLLDCWNFDLPFVQYMSARLKLNPRAWEEFRLIRIQDCPYLQESEVKKLFPAHTVEVLETLDEMHESD